VGFVPKFALSSGAIRDLLAARIVGHPDDPVNEPRDR
jgi:hypothetical protein